MKRNLLLVLICSIMLIGLLSMRMQNALRMSIPKSSVSLVPPANFILSDFYDGFLHKATNSSIIAKKEPGQAYSYFNQRFTAQYLQNIGLTLIKQEEIKTKEMEGTLYLISYVVKETNMHRYMLVTGDSKDTYIVMANYPVGYKSKISEPIKRSLMTVQYK